MMNINWWRLFGAVFTILVSIAGWFFAGAIAVTLWAHFNGWEGWL